MAELAVNADITDRDMHRVEVCLDKLGDALARSDRRSNHLMDEAFMELRELYMDSAEVVRFNIASALGSMSTSQGLELLELALREDSSSLVRHEAAFSLGEMGDESIIPLLVEVGLHDRSYLVRHETAMALARVGDESALPALEEGLRDDEHEVVVSCQLAIASIRHRLAV